MRVSAWFRPPRQILAIFLTVAAMSAVALGGLAWQLLEQDRDLETQRQQVQLEQKADALVAAMQQELADLQAHVGAESPPDQPLARDVVAITITSEHIASSPAGRLLYYPAPPLGRQVSPLVFAEGEQLEFRAADLSAAAGVYTRLAETRDPVVRGGALMRLARVCRKRGAYQQALDTYAALAALDLVVVDELPSALLARLGRISVLEQAGRRQELGEEATRLVEDLQAGRWQLTKAQYDTVLDDCA